jgi:hypothetical protein
LAVEKNSSRKLIAVDNYSWNPFGLSEVEHKLVTGLTTQVAVKHLNVQLFAGSSEEFWKAHSNELIAGVFIDADHTYDAVKCDIRLAIENGVRIISGHDYSDIHPGVVRAVNEAFPEGVKVYGTVWIAPVQPKQIAPSTGV